MHTRDLLVFETYALSFGTQGKLVGLKEELLYALNHSHRSDDKTL